MKYLGRLSLAVLASAAFLSPPSSRAAVVSISHEKLNECGRGFVFCNGQQAYSLSDRKLICEFDWYFNVTRPVDVSMCVSADGKLFVSDETCLRIFEV